MSYISQQRKWKKAIRDPCIAEQGMVASKHPLIGMTGIDIMQRGGNAIDAAVAAAFVDCVVEPAMNGIGGEGVMAIHTADGKNVIIDYVGRPSNNCTSDMYELVDEPESGWMGWRRVKNDANITGYKASTVPGTVAGLAKAIELYGTMDLEELMEPAIKIAAEGYVIGWWTVSHILKTMETFIKFPEWRKIFLKNGQYPPKPFTHSIKANPDVLVNKDLAMSLKLIAMEGPDAFYKGDIAEAIAKDMANADGLITLEDLVMYEPIIVDPIPCGYRDYEVIYDPSHAGTTVMEVLNIVEGFELSGYDFGSFEHIHVMAEALGLAFADRFEYMG
ncbi:MAG: gamma-glutamyltransferase, partial [Candidatus Hermodarchaeia archaeon]